MKRRQLSPKTLAAENAAVTQFLFDKCVPKEGSKQPLQHFYADYNKWRRMNKMEPTVLTIDGFGRLFPKSYPRKSSYWPPIKHALKCVFGLVVENETKTR